MIQLAGVLFDKFVKKKRSPEEFRLRWPYVAREVFKDFNTAELEILMADIKKKGLAAVLEAENARCTLDAAFERQLSVDVLHPAVTRNRSASLSDMFSIER